MRPPAVLGRHKVRYYRCPACGFIQTEPPFWLEESYKSPMTSYDLGGISRPTLNSVLTKAVVNWFFDAGGRFLDFGGGFGVFTRWMRDEGYDFFHYDQHCPNLFAPGHDADISGSVRYELVTAFEVFEHLAEPAKTVAHLLSISDSILFSTEPLPFYLRRLPTGGITARSMASISRFLRAWRFSSLLHVSAQITTRMAVLSI